MSEGDFGKVAGRRRRRGLGRGNPGDNGDPEAADSGTERIRGLNFDRSLQIATLLVAALAALAAAYQPARDAWESLHKKSGARVIVDPKSGVGGVAVMAVAQPTAGQSPNGYLRAGSTVLIDCRQKFLIDTAGHFYLYGHLASGQTIEGFVQIEALYTGSGASADSLILSLPDCGE